MDYTRRDVFQAIADPNRRAIISLLAGKKLTVNEVALNFKISRPAVSKHIRILSECGLVKATQIGAEKFCEVKLEKLNEVSDWVEQYRKYWTSQLDSLDDYLKKIQTNKIQNKEKKNVSRKRKSRK
ncbi:MAG: winged helix-turn-helix transcriptional regulator [Bacteroidetes bacterium]|nr:winged helix-turn-helix transcriptional regulator [Bacteroidota bacterium]MBX7044604.1 metalloregulator ArsR/SmtB family transcription factor [Ignavibacteria bacterium]